LKRVRIDADLIGRFAILEDDVLINRVNSPEHLGKAALVPALSEPTVFESNMMRLRLDPARTDAGFMVAQLLTPHVKRQIATASKDAINQSSINQPDVRVFQVRLPPLILQRRWRAFAAEHREQVALWSKAGEMVDRGFNSLLHHAFAGEVGSHHAS
jgi:type I restriction enzyme S subunit